MEVDDLEKSSEFSGEALLLVLRIEQVLLVVIDCDFWSGTSLPGNPSLSSVAFRLFRSSSFPNPKDLLIVYLDFLFRWIKTSISNMLQVEFSRRPNRRKQNSVVLNGDERWEEFYRKWTMVMMVTMCTWLNSLSLHACDNPTRLSPTRYPTDEEGDTWKRARGWNIHVKPTTTDTAAPQIMGTGECAAVGEGTRERQSWPTVFKTVGP